MDTGNYSVISNSDFMDMLRRLISRRIIIINMNLVHWPLMGGLLHLVQLGAARPGPSSLYQM